MGGIKSLFSKSQIKSQVQIKLQVLQELGKAVYL